VSGDVDKTAPQSGDALSFLNRASGVLSGFAG